MTISSVAASVTVLKTGAVQPKQQSISPQMEFSISLDTKKDTYRATGGVIFKWEGTHWQSQEPMKLESEALRFLFNVAPDRTNEKLAKSAVATAALYLKEMPERLHSGGFPTPIIPTLNGSVEIDGGFTKLRDSRREDGLTYVINCKYEPLSPCPRFDAFLTEALPDADVRAFLQEYAGYTLLSDTRHEIAAWLIGEGGTGKGTFGVIMQSLHRQCVALSLDELDRFNLAKLPGASLVYVDETPQGRIHEQKLKSCISGDTINSDVKNRDAITFAPTAKWIVNGNNLPVISDYTSGFWRRWLIFPFHVKPAKKQPMLAETIIETELSGVLNWALMGLQRLLKRGEFPVLPMQMQKFADAVKTDSNSVLSWIEGQDVAISATTNAESSVYRHYSKWCLENGMKSVNSTNFWKRLAVALPNLAHSKPRKGGKQVRSINVSVSNLSDVDDHYGEMEYRRASGGY